MPWQPTQWQLTARIRMRKQLLIVATGIDRNAQPHESNVSLAATNGKIAEDCNQQVAKKTRCNKKAFCYLEPTIVYV